MCSNVKIIKQKKKEKCFFNYWFWKVLTRSNGLLNVNDVNFIMVGVLGSETSLGTGEESLALALRAGGKVSYKKYNLLLYCWHLFPITLISANSAFLSFGRWVCDPEQPLRSFRRCNGMCNPQQMSSHIQIRRLCVTKVYLFGFVFQWPGQWVMTFLIDTWQ